MKWLNLEIATLRSPEFIGSNPAERAAWLCVLGYCVEQENGGRMEGAAHWKDRQWQQACGVTLKEVRSANKLLAFDDDDLLVSFYPLTQQSEVQELRALGNTPSAKKAEAARLNGLRGGRPKITQEITHANPPNNPPITQEEPTVTHGEPIQGKGKEGKEREGEKPTRAPSGENLSEEARERENQAQQRREFIEARGGLTRRYEVDLLPEWDAICKGMNNRAISAIFTEAKPGILWPSEFKAHRAAKGSY